MVEKKINIKYAKMIETSHEGENKNKIRAVNAVYRVINLMDVNLLMPNIPNNNRKNVMTITGLHLNWNKSCAAKTNIA